MAKKRTLNTYENQAWLSVGLAAVGALGMLGAIVLLARNADANFFQTYWINYSPKSSYLPSLAISLMVACVAAGIGFLVGWNSAGQKRNTRSQLAWLGFFLCAGVITLSLCTGLLFYVTRHAVER